MGAAKPVTNRPRFPNFSITAPGTAEQFTSILIPDGYTTTFKNPIDSNGNFYLAETAADAQSSAGDRKVLQPGESITLEIDNLNRLYFDGDNAMDQLEVTVLAPSG